MITYHKEGYKGPQAIDKSSIHPPADLGRADSLTLARWVSYLASSAARLSTWTTFTSLKVQAQQGYNLASVSYPFASLAARAQE